VSNVPSQTLAFFKGSLISEAKRPHGLFLTPLYLGSLKKPGSAAAAAAAAVVPPPRPIFKGSIFFKFQDDPENQIGVKTFKN
jgi:hypothetical protein